MHGNTNIQRYFNFHCANPPKISILSSLNLKIIVTIPIFTHLRSLSRRQRQRQWHQAAQSLPVLSIMPYKYALHKLVSPVCSLIYTHEYCRLMKSVCVCASFEKGRKPANVYNQNQFSIDTHTQFNIFDECGGNNVSNPNQRNSTKKTVRSF